MLRLGLFPSASNGENLEKRNITGRHCTSARIHCLFTEGMLGSQLAHLTVWRQFSVTCTSLCASFAAILKDQQPCAMLPQP